MQHRMSTGQTILVVDDEPSINLAIDRVFRDTDVRVITATSMTEGEQAFKDNQPDVAYLTCIYQTDQAWICFLA